MRRAWIVGALGAIVGAGVAFGPEASWVTLAGEISAYGLCVCDEGRA